MTEPTPEEIERDAKVVLGWMLDGSKALPDNWDAGWFMVGAATNLATALLRSSRTSRIEDRAAMLMAGSLLMAGVVRQADADLQTRTLLGRILGKERPHG